MIKKLATLALLFLSTQFLFSQNDDNINPILSSKFLVRAGLFSPIQQVKIGANGSVKTDIFDDIDFDETFKLNGFQNTFTANFMWRFSKSKKWSVSTDYFKIGNENKVTLKEDIEWDDLIFKEGSKIKGGFGLALYKVFFGRVISRGQKHELGGGIGVHALRVNGFIKGNAIVNAGEDDEHVEFANSEVSAILPLPNFGFWYYYAPHKKWALTAHLDWFGIEIGDVSGVLWNINPGVRYQAFKNIGFSIDYKYLKIGADIDKDDWKGDFSMQFQGPSFTVTGNF